ncbi:hypothetical protein VCRA2110O2_30093 [Vibrio crassostreae]|nr:hypothetical protein VCHA44O286_50284 [Vibrio chagasii]CAK2848265.1 hypothetical protein VCRA2110O2_30093 [Vibrio crassostreae]
MNPPNFVKNILIAKGIGFEGQGFDQLIWNNFVSQFGHKECSNNVREAHFSHYIDSTIKSGGIERVKAELSATPQFNNVRERPIRQSKLAEFEEKAAIYLSQFPDDDEADDEIFLSESELLWQAYLALQNGGLEERQAMLDKLENHFQRVGKPLFGARTLPLGN